MIEIIRNIMQSDIAIIISFIATIGFITGAITWLFKTVAKLADTKDNKTIWHSIFISIVFIIFGLSAPLYLILEASSFSGWLMWLMYFFGFMGLLAFVILVYIIAVPLIISNRFKKQDK